MTNYDILKEYEVHQTPVPTFDELQNMNKAVNECMAANIKLVEQNAQLKELLRECLAHLTIGKYGTSVTPINILCDEVEEVLK